MKDAMRLTLSSMCSLFFLALCQNAQSQNRPSLLKIVEVEHSGKELDHSLARATISVDIHSQLWITPQQDSITKLIGSETSVTQEQVSEQRLRSRALLLDILNNTDTLAALAQKAAQLYIAYKPGDSLILKEFRANTRQFNKLSSRRNANLKDYLMLRGYSETEAADTIDSIFPSNGDYTKLRVFLNRELQRIDTEISHETQDVYSHATKARVILAAQLIQDNQTNGIHLPSYDSKPNEYHEPIPKITFQLTDKQKEDLKEKRQYYENLAATVRDVQTTKNGVSGFLDEQRKNFQETLDTLRNVCVLAADVFVGAYKNDLKDNAKKAFSTHQDLILKYDALVDALYGSQITARAIRDTLAYVVQELIPTPTSNAPEDYLSGVMDHIDTLSIILQKQLPAFITEVQKTATALKDFDTAMAKVKDVDINSLEFNHAQSAVQLLHSIDIQKDVVDLLQSKIPLLTTLIASKDYLSDATKGSGQLKAIGGLLINDGSYIQKPLAELVPTNINIATAGADEGSTIRLTLQMYDVQDSSRLLYEQDQFFEIRKFGISSDVSAGLVFINAIDPPYVGKIRNAPTASTEYLFRIRPCRIEYDYVSIGIHAVILNFDSSIPIEIGMGFSVHFFGDVLQTGYGWNLHAPGTPRYWYVGLGILDLLNSARKLTF